MVAIMVMDTGDPNLHLPDVEDDADDNGDTVSPDGRSKNDDDDPDSSPCLDNN